MRTLKDFLVEYNTKANYGLEDESLQETLVESFETVYTGGRDEHRWYDVYDAVIKIDIDGEDRYFQTFYYETKGDGNADDYGLEKATIDKAFEVYPHTVSTIVYKSEPQT